VALLVDVGARAEKHVHHVAVRLLHSGHQRGLAETVVLERFVEPRLQLWRRVEHAGDFGGVVGPNRVEECAHLPQPGIRNAPIRVE
jgi:hypothetical protein